MCKGREDQSCPSSLCINKLAKEDQICNPLLCELCSAKAALYCQADNAFLCRKCDRWVHGANFLAQRHIRCLLCRNCDRLTQRYLVGTSAEVILPKVVRLKKRNQGIIQCNSDLDHQTEDSRAVKKPFLFL